MAVGKYAIYPLPVEVLREILIPDFSSGCLIWKPRPCDSFCGSGYFKAWNDKFPGTLALNVSDNNGYKVGKLVGKKIYKAHRVIWALAHDRWPDNFIDHIDGNPANNSLKNLRTATHSQNAANSRIASSNRSGFKGVCWHKKDLAWQAAIKVDGKVLYLGHFNTAEAAHAAYCEAAKKHHGEFARFA